MIGLFAVNDSTTVFAWLFVIFNTLQVMPIMHADMQLELYSMQINTSVFVLECAKKLNIYGHKAILYCSTVVLPRH